MLENNELDGDEVDLERVKYWDECREGWSKHLDEFEKEMYYPVFAKHNIPKAQALVIWHTNCLKNAMLDADEDEDGEWRKSGPQ